MNYSLCATMTWPVVMTLLRQAHHPPTATLSYSPRMYGTYLLTSHQRLHHGLCISSLFNYYDDDNKPYYNDSNIYSVCMYCFETTVLMMGHKKREIGRMNSQIDHICKLNAWANGRMSEYKRSPASPESTHPHNNTNQAQLTPHRVLPRLVECAKLQALHLGRGNGCVRS